MDLTVTSAFNQPFRADVVDRMLAVPQVASASPGVQRVAPLPRSVDAPPDALAQLVVVGIDLATVGSVHDFPLAAGRMLAAGDNAAVVLNSDLAGQLALGVGDQLVLPAAGGTARFRVIGLLSSVTVPGQEQVYLTLPAAQQLFGLGARITQVEAAFTPGADRAATEQAVATALGPDYQVGGLSSQSTLLASLQTATFAFNMFGLFALATAGFIIANSFRTVVAERRRDIGMLRAIGTRRRTVMGMFLVESLIQGLIGTALGLVAGWGLAAGLFAVMAPDLRERDALPRPVPDVQPRHLDHLDPARASASPSSRRSCPPAPPAGSRRWRRCGRSWARSTSDASAGARGSASGWWSRPCSG